MTIIQAWGDYSGFIPKMIQKLVFDYVGFAANFSPFTRALCLHNGRSLQGENLRSLLVKNQLLNHFRYTAT